MKIYLYCMKNIDIMTLLIDIAINLNEKLNYFFLAANTFCANYHEKPILFRKNVY